MSDTELVLDFDRSLYLPAGVEAAIEAYEGYASEISLDAGPESLRVTLRGFDPGYKDVIGDSFANHALFETVVRARDALGEVRA